MDPTLLAEGDYWAWTCGVCGLSIQGGREGLDMHMGTVHPEVES